MNLLRMKIDVMDRKISVLEEKINEELLLSKMISFVVGESKAKETAKKLID
ncbi:MAG: hypothetical protein AB8B68_05190 [Rickettsiaceae bacterium]